MNLQAECIKAYEKHKHLKLAGKDVGIPWQTLYWHLKKAGVAVTGDKERYGSDGDKLAALSEKDFMRLVPFAQDMNRRKFQNKYDFLVNGKKVDLKSARPKGETKSGSKRWSFSLKKQQLETDYFVCFAYGDDLTLIHCLLIPSEIAEGYTSLALSPKGKRWWDYLVKPEELAAFFAGHAE